MWAWVVFLIFIVYIFGKYAVLCFMGTAALGKEMVTEEKSNCPTPTVYKDYFVEHEMTDSDRDLIISDYKERILADVKKNKEYLLKRLAEKRTDHPTYMYAFFNENKSEGINIARAMDYLFRQYPDLIDPFLFEFYVDEYWQRHFDIHFCPTNYMHHFFEDYDLNSMLTPIIEKVNYEATHTHVGFAPYPIHYIEDYSSVRPNSPTGTTKRDENAQMATEYLISEKIKEANKKYSEYQTGYTFALFVFLSVCIITFVSAFIQGDNDAFVGVIPAAFWGTVIWSVIYAILEWRRAGKELNTEKMFNHPHRFYDRYGKRIEQNKK